MDFTATKKDFVTALGRIQGVPDQKNLTSAMAHVHMVSEGSSLVRVTARCYEALVSVTFPAEVAAQGELALSGRSLFDAARMLPEAPVRVQKLANDWASVMAGRTDYKIPGMSPEHLPEREAPKPTDYLTVPVSLLNEMVERVGFAVSTDEGRPNLNGVFIKVEPKDAGAIVEMVATDGHRLSRLVRHVDGDVNVGQTLKVILHRRGVQELRRFLADDQSDVRFGFQRTAVIFENSTGYLMVNQIELEYPDYVRVLPTEFKWQFTVSRQDLVRAIQRTSIILTSDKVPVVKLSFRSGHLQVSAQDPTRGDAQDEVDLNYEGDPIEIAFNYRYLLDALNALPGGTAVISVRDLYSAVSFTSPDDEGILQLIMPVRT